jgi:ferredoxin--NADP+ reductase
VITRACCNDAICVSVCPVDCIHPTPDEAGYDSAEQLYIDPATCIDCNACAEACPVNAIFADVELHPEAQPFIAINAGYYTQAPR